MKQSTTLFVRTVLPGLVLGLAGLAFFSPGLVRAATLTLTTNQVGTTPAILAYNSGHFYTNSNTRDWWRYAGVNGARVFLSPSEIEPSDDLAPVGDGVDSRTAFEARKQALRADPLNPAYINWGGSSVFSNRYENNDLYPNNHIKPNYTFREMRKLGIAVCAQLTAGQSRFPLAGPDDWPNLWELWQHYYAQAFYLARVFDVERFQMFNEPNHANANGLTIPDHLLRLQVVSDAVQCAVADVNLRYGRTLSARVLAPVTSGTADGSYNAWGESVVTNRHLHFLGHTDPNFSLIHVYDYHQYGSAPATFGTDLADLHSRLSGDMAPEPRYPTAISEFNTDTGASFDTQVETLDSPGKYARFGAILTHLVANGCRELYAFKFSQTERDPPTTYPVAKNAMHYVDNVNAPYNVGGITRAGEVYRLFNKALAAGRPRLQVLKDAGASGLDVLASHDPVRNRFLLFSVNNTTNAVTLDAALGGIALPAGARFVVEEVSEACYGGVRLLGTVPTGGVTPLGTQPARTVWLTTILGNGRGNGQVFEGREDAEVRDGTNRTSNYGSAPVVTVRNDPASASNRRAALVKFDLGAVSTSQIESAVLSFDAAAEVAAVTAQAHVYGLSAADWSETNVTWATTANLRQNIPAGNTIARLCVSGSGETAFVVGQLLVDSTNRLQKVLDVTDWLRRQTNPVIGFLVSQDPRWDVALPSLDTGDTQASGVVLGTREGGAPARLRLWFKPGSEPVNGTPAPRPDSASTSRHVPVTIPVLANDEDPDNHSLEVVAFSTPARGAVTDAGGGSLTYWPYNEFTGVDNFTYTVSDGWGGSNSAIVTVTVSPSWGPPVWTNLPAGTEAFVRGGVNADTDPDEVATGYLMMKYSSPSLDNARKVYFQFPLGGARINPGSEGWLSFGFLNNYKQNVQLWALNQACPALIGAITWNSAQANNTANNNLLTAGLLTATPIGPVTNLPSSGMTPAQLNIPSLSAFVQEDQITLALTGAPDSGSYTNNASGLRLLRTNAVLQVQITPPGSTESSVAPTVADIRVNPSGRVTLDFLGAANRIHWLQASHQPAGDAWTTLSTNASGPDGRWSATDAGPQAFIRRFYRAVLP